MVVCVKVMALKVILITTSTKPFEFDPVQFHDKVFSKL